MWAHNYHLAADHPAIEDTALPAGAITLGSELAHRNPGDYHPVALTAYRPEIDWPGQTDGPGETDLGTTRDALEKRLYTDFDAEWIVYDPRGSWLAPDRERRLSEELMHIDDNYDAVLFLRHSPAMSPVLW